MKLFFEESKPTYQSYLFPYSINAYFEIGDNIDHFLEMGFLPTRTLDHNRFYMGRSVRVNLNQFSLSSENRRILNKTESVSYEKIPITNFVYNYHIQKFCKDYFDNRFGHGKMSASAIKRIFTNSWNNYVYVFKDNDKDKIIGYVAHFENEKCDHYAYPFYDLDYFKQNLGARMILTAIMDAANAHKQYVYLGTLYEASALYKSEFEGFEWWNGNDWGNDKTILKNLINTNNQ